MRPHTPLEFPMTFHWVGMKIFWNPTLSEENKTATVAWWITTSWSNKLKLHLLVRRKSTDFILIFFLYIDSYWTSVCPWVHCGKHGRLYHFSQVLSLKNEIRHYWFLDNVLIWLWQKKNNDFSWELICCQVSVFSFITSFYQYSDERLWNGRCGLLMCQVMFLWTLYYMQLMNWCQS